MVYKEGKKLNSLGWCYVKIFSMEIKNLGESGLNYMGTVKIRLDTKLCHGIGFTENYSLGHL